MHKKNKNPKAKLSLDDLEIESFETVGQAVTGGGPCDSGACHLNTCPTHCGTCYNTCDYSCGQNTCNGGPC